MAGPSREGEILDGKYRIVRKLGEGGMGAVYAGEHMRLKKAVAIKMLHAGAAVHAEMADRFEREAQAASHIGSDHIVEVYDIGVTPSGDRFMVMEYLEGEPLRTRLKRLKRLREGEIAELAVQMLEGLAAAHRAGIVHRDLKPDNVFICREKSGRRDFVKVLDFGISKFSQAGEAGSMTKTGTIMGSPNYMSPEHVQASHDVDARSDLYSAGVMLFEAVTGKLPRKAATFAEILFKVVYEPVPDPRTIEPGVDPDFAAIVMTACAHQREQRYQSAEQFKAALEGYLRQKGPQARAPLAAGAPVPDDEGSERTVALVAGVPPPLPSGPGSISQPYLSGSQPSFGGASHPSVPHPVAASGSQPSFAGGSQPSFASGSQPSFAGGSQPSFGGGSQPSFASGSQPSYSGPQSTSQPPFGSGSQPSYASPFSVTHQPTGELPRPKRKLGLGVAIGGAALAGVAVAVVLVTQLPASGNAGTASSGRPSATVPSAPQAPQATTPASPPVATAAPEPSAVPEVPASATSPAASSPTPAKVSGAGPAKSAAPTGQGKPGGGIKAGY